MIKYIIDNFEKNMIALLCLMMIVAISLGTIELGVIFVKTVMAPPVGLISLNNLQMLFGNFFMILIGLELFETIKTYLSGNQVHVETVFIVALIAIARKIILLDYKKAEFMGLFAIAALIISLAFGLFLIRKENQAEPTKKKK